jgi:hypothetical protein
MQSETRHTQCTIIIPCIKHNILPPPSRSPCLAPPAEAPWAGMKPRYELAGCSLAIDMIFPKG